MKTSTIIGLLIFFTTVYNLNSQTVEVLGEAVYLDTKKHGTPIELGYIDGREFRGNKEEFHIYEKGKLIKKEKYPKTHKNNKVIVTNEHIYYFYRVGKFKHNESAFYMEKRDFDFNIEGERIKVLDPYLERDGSSKVTVNPQVGVELEVLYNKQSDRFLLNFHLKFSKEKRNYFKSALINSAGETINIVAYEIKEKGGEIEFNTTRIMDNGSAFFAFTEFRGHSDGHRNVVGNAVVYMPNDGSEFMAMTVEPDERFVSDIGIASSIDDEGNAYFGMLSRKDAKDEKGVLGLYKFNVNSLELDRSSYEINAEGQELREGLSSFHFDDIVYGKDNSKYIYISSKRYANHLDQSPHVIIKVDKQDEIVWTNAFHTVAMLYRYDITPKGVISFLDVNGDLNFIFNTPEHQFETGAFHYSIMSHGRILFADAAKTMRAKFDAETGELEYEILKFEGEEKCNLTLGTAEKLDEGVYRLQLRLKGENKSAIVDFN